MMRYLSELNTVPDIVRYHREQRPDQIAIRFGTIELTYTDLDIRANQVAQTLLAAGLGQGDRLVWLGRNSHRFFECMFAAAKIGAVMTPVNWRLTPAEIVRIVEDAEPRLIFTELEFQEKVVSFRESHQLILIDADPSSAHAYDSWSGDGDLTDPALDTDPELPFVQIYTSGTTGVPKGAMLSHRAMLALLGTFCCDRCGDFGPEHRCLVAMPIFHVGGTTWGMNGLYAGSTLVLLSDANPGLILNTVRDERITHMFIVPAIIQMILELKGADAEAFSSAASVCYGASPIPQPVLEQAIRQLQCGFRQMYGMTEMTGAIAIMDTDEHVMGLRERPEVLKSCGKMLDGVELRIVDEADNEVAVGEIGEVLLRGSMLMNGYWRREEATREAVRDGWYYSGDAGYLDEDGFLYICDRIKDMIISGGENIYPAEIESVLMAHSNVADAAVVGIPNEKWGEEVKAFIVLKAGTQLSAGAIIDFCREQLARFKLPKSVDFVDELPRNGAGKIQKTELRKPFWETRGRNV